MILLVVGVASLVAGIWMLYIAFIKTCKHLKGIFKGDI